MLVLTSVSRLLVIDIFLQQNNANGNEIKQANVAFRKLVYYSFTRGSKLKYLLISFVVSAPKKFVLSFFGNRVTSEKIVPSQSVPILDLAKAQDFMMSDPADAAFFNE